MMAALSKTDLDNLYRRYDFRSVDTFENLGIYTFQGPYFRNAEVVPLAGGIDTTRAREMLERSGFSVRVRQLSPLSEVEDKLFAGFFRRGPSRERAAASVADFYRRLSQYLGFDYEYIPVPYECLDGDTASEPTLVARVLDLFERAGPQLVFIEAPAGFGKTCTAIEVLQGLLASSQRSIPVLMELSRNRQAPVFRYVLLDEIDRTFNLKSSLVESEIKTGRVPVIIDGFDELLSRRAASDSDSETLEDAESMLDTIASLLHGEAKVLVTTRRTALFAGEAFSQWVEDLEHCNVSRFLIQTPSVDEWIGPGRRAELERRNFPVGNLSNPVLLSFLRRQAEDDFTSLCQNPEEIVDRYFELLLDRERNRQDLLMTPDDQLIVLRRIASHLLDADVTGDSSDALRSVVLGDPACIRILDATSRLYTGERALSKEKLVDKFLVHALLDRKADRDLTVFINDFVLGTLQGDVLIGAEDPEWAGSDSQVDRIITSYELQPQARRVRLWELLEMFREVGDKHVRMAIDMRLRGEPVGFYDGGEIEDYEFRNLDFGEDATFDGTTFHQCVFRKCTFHLGGLSSIGFLECAFYSCRVGEAKPSTLSVNWEAGTKAGDPEFLNSLTGQAACETEPAAETDYKKRVLEQFWRPGAAHARLKLDVRTLYRGSGPRQRPAISRAISELERSGLISSERRKYVLDITRIGEISELLGRGGTPDG